MILGEGAAMFVLDALDAARAIRAGLRNAALQPEQIAYINAHGAATPANDPTEVAAIRSGFGAHAGRLPDSSAKSMHGHALGQPRRWKGLLRFSPSANYQVPTPTATST